MSTDGEASIVFAGGKAQFGPFTTTTYMMSFQSSKVRAIVSPAQALDSDFRSMVNPCTKTFRLSGKNSEYEVIIRAEAPPKTFAMVSIPTETQYQPNGGMESFSATIEVEVYENGFWANVFNKKLLDRRVFKNAALEFGNEFMRCVQP